MSLVSPEDLFGSSWTADPTPEGEPEYGRNNMGMGGVGEEDENAAEEPVSAEPGPDWDNAKMVWKEAWEFHLYIFGCLFGLLGLYMLVCVIRLWRIHRLLSRRYFVSLNLLMLLLCATRAVYLMLDGYNSHGTFHPSLDYFFYSISFPCLTSAFSIQLYALLEATKMQFLPPTIQTMSLLMTIVVVHFAISIATDVVVGMYAGMEIMLFVCQLFFILWGLFLFFGYAYIFRRLYVHAVKRQKNVVQNNGSVYGGGGGLAKPKARFTLSVAVTVTMLTAVLGLVTVALEVYAVVGVYKTFSNDRPQPWPWYFYHTALRLVEFLMCATMGYVASQPFRYRRREQSCCCPVLCAPCAEICYCGNDANRSEAQAGWSELDQHQLRTSIDRGQPVGVGYHHDGYHSNGNALRGSKNS
ncbi:proline-rich transmembrane protein 4-like [Littorina saxatilis]|uniref:Proline-rich transmembrane protein 3/4 domain-containing protein n=1 Tax=Littorina saxatilis TaxID=31220 RepID=A0AAN9BAS4_9CAEN